MAKSPTGRAPDKEPDVLTPRSIRMPPDVHAAVRRAAATEDRTVTSLLIHIIRTWLVQHGYLPQPRPAARRPRG
jgi:hypothetical protein